MSQSDAKTLQTEMKSLYEYDNYRDYLRDYYAFAKARNKNFSFRVFSMNAGFSSPGILMRVMNGERNLSIEGIEKFTKALKLKNEESVFFRYLVQLNQSKKSEEKLMLANEIARLRSYRKIYPLKSLQLRFHSEWYYTVIREMVLLPDFREDSNWIASHIHPRITPREAEKAIRDLLELSMLARDDSGKLIQTNKHVSTGDEISSGVLVHYHKEVLKRAGDSMETIPREERDISSMTLGISVETAKKVKERIQRFRKDIVDLCSQDERVETVYYMNMQLFPAVFEKNSSGKKGE